MTTVFALLRWPNLMIVGLTLYFLKYAGLFPLYSAAQQPFDVNSWQFLLLAFDMMLVTGAGYVINDIYDYPIDILNKPEKVFVGKRISLKGAYTLYAGLFIAGLCVSTWLAYSLNYWHLLPTFPIAWGLLWLYSYWLKKTPFWGNLLVGLFCGAVTLMVWLTEWHSYMQLKQHFPQEAQALQTILLFYALFALLSTLFREVVKDIEDMEGDARYHCRTLPIVYGEKPAKAVAILMGLLLVLAVATWLLAFEEYVNKWAWVYGACCIAMPSLYACFLTFKARSTADYHRSSKIIKYIMLAGLLYLPVITWPHF
jgi:4-hydroxybenzoate polyprenyltransferase